MHVSFKKFLKMFLMYEKNIVKNMLCLCFQFELIYFHNIWLTLHEQYRWLQVDYQIGVFLSRSSVNLFVVRKLWIIAFLQVSSWGVFT